VWRQGCAGGVADGAALAEGVTGEAGEGEDAGGAAAEDDAGTLALGARPTSSQPRLPFSEWQR
jgi:hypothetical protein